MQERSQSRLEQTARGASGQESREFRVRSLGPLDGVVVLEVGGEVDFYSAPELKAVLERALDEGIVRLVVDLTEVSFIDTSGIGVLVAGLRRVRPSGGSMALVCIDKNIRRLFEITALDRVFSIYATRKAALKAMAG